MKFELKPVEFPGSTIPGWEWPLLWEIDFDPETPASTFRKALRLEKWEKLDMGYGLQNTPLRQIARSLRSVELDAVERAFRHPAFKLQLIDTLSAVPFFRTLWPTDRLIEITEVTTMWAKDLPGFVSPPHLDNRLLLCTGMIFFNEEPDVRMATHFSKTFGGPVYKTSGSGFGQGWLLAHDHHGWHHGGNGSDADRYHLTFHLRIRS